MSLLTKTLTATIASAASLSNAVCLGDGMLCGILMSASWTAASLTFQVSEDGTTWKDLYDEAGSEIALAPTSPAGKRLAVGPDSFAGVIFLKVRSGTTGSPVAQAAERTLTLIARKFNPVS